MQSDGLREGFLMSDKKKVVSEGEQVIKLWFKKRRQWRTQQDQERLCETVAFFITIHSHKPASLNVYRQIFSVRHLQLFFFTAVLTILCSRGPFDMLLIVIIFTIQKSDFFMRQGIQSCLCKEMLAENCTAQNEAWCRLSAGQQESTEPQPAVRLAYEETLRLCALLLKVRALLTFECLLSKSYLYLFFLQCFLK